MQGHYHKQDLGTLDSHNLHCSQLAAQENLVKMDTLHSPQQGLDHKLLPVHQAVHMLEQAGHLAEDSLGQMQVVPDYTHRKRIPTHKEDMLAAWAHLMHMDTAVVVVDHTIDLIEWDLDKIHLPVDQA